LVQQQGYMKILLTGGTGYIAQRLLPVLLEQGHVVICCVRDKLRFNHQKYFSKNLQVIEIDFLYNKNFEQIPNDIDVAYYLIHSMAALTGDFEQLEALCAQNFRDCMSETQVKQVIYLSGIVNEATLSKHLTSRKNVEMILESATYALTTLRAGIIVGSGSASFEIIRDLVEKLPFMITPKWVNTRCQPIAIRNVIEFLDRVKWNEQTYNQAYDIGGPDILSYKEMMQRFARVRKFRIFILVVPVMTPRISAYWLYFVTSTSFTLAKNLVNSMKVEVICRPNNLAQLLGITLIDYDYAIRMAFDKIEQNQVLSSWKDAQTSDILKEGISRYIEVPVNGCFKDTRRKKVKDGQTVLQRIWAIGGKTGWYYANWLWEVRGILDQMVGGVGMRRGRKSATEVFSGDAIDFWRVLLANKEEKRLLLYAEMKLPGEAWLEFKIDENDVLTQTATFRPVGLMGRLYWFAVLPFHSFIFQGLIDNISNTANLSK